MTLSLATTVPGTWVNRENRRREGLWDTGRRIRSERYSVYSTVLIALSEVLMESENVGQPSENVEEIPFIQMERV